MACPVPLIPVVDAGRLGRSRFATLPDRSSPFFWDWTLWSPPDASNPIICGDGILGGAFRRVPTPGDFAGDGKADIALTDGTGFMSIPVAFSNGDGTFHATDSVVANFPAWTTEHPAHTVAGDFDGMDARTSLSSADRDGRAFPLRCRTATAHFE